MSRGVNFSQNLVGFLPFPFPSPLPLLIPFPLSPLPRPFRFPSSLSQSPSLSISLPPNPSRGLGSPVSSPSGVRGGAPAADAFRWTLQGSKVVGSGPQVRAEIDASANVCFISDRASTMPGFYPTPRRTLICLFLVMTTPQPPVGVTTLYTGTHRVCTTHCAAFMDTDRYQVC